MPGAYGYLRNAADSMILALHQVAVGCTNLDRSIDFCSTLLGAEPHVTFDPPGLAFYILGETRFLLERSKSVPPGSSTLYFPVSDLENRCAALRAEGVVFESEPHLIHTDEAGRFGKVGTEEWMAFLRDPDDNSLALVERRPRAPAA
jgi:methylmalonyl-CoA/ethylmalonyl-CoA epimerase